jgi:hypothetical protein
MSMISEDVNEHLMMSGKCTGASSANYATSIVGCIMYFRIQVCGPNRRLSYSHKTPPERFLIFICSGIYSFRVATGQTAQTKPWGERTNLVLRFLTKKWNSILKKDRHTILIGSVDLEQSIEKDLGLLSSYGKCFRLLQGRCELCQIDANYRRE